MDNQIKRRQIAGSLAGLWLVILLGNVAFRHAHRLADGRIISHVHPYKYSKHQFPDHQHTHSELIWLDFIANSPFELPELPAFDLQVTVDLFSRVVFFYNIVEKEQLSTPTFLRGPPVDVMRF